jgi:murein L,D-transpeptidase YafK
MRFWIFIVPILLVCLGMTPSVFREKQLNYTRVRVAYAQKEKTVVKTLDEHSISRDSMMIYLRAFKTEQKLELWAKNIKDSAYILLKEFPICDLSGEVGPKRRSRDLQVPEGFYHIIDLNPFSGYYLSIQINYPNASDSIRGVRGHLGNEIFIHGGCISSGCLAMTDDRIMELFVYCIEAYNSGQKEIELTIFPSELTDNSYNELTSEYCKYKDELSLWADLKKSYDLFEKYKVPPVVKFLPDGTHDVIDPLVQRQKLIAEAIEHCGNIGPMQIQEPLLLPSFEPRKDDTVAPRFEVVPYTDLNSQRTSIFEKRWWK